MRPWLHSNAVAVSNYYNHATVPPDSDDLYVRVGEVFDGDPAKPTYWRHNSTGSWYAHKAVDIAMPIDTPLYAPWKSTVVTIGHNDSRGWYVLIKALMDGVPRYLSFSHLSAVLVGQGMTLQPGYLIGLSGDSGWSGGPHVHLEAGEMMWGNDIDLLQHEATRYWFHGLPYAQRESMTPVLFLPWSLNGPTLTVNGMHELQTYQEERVKLVFQASGTIRSLWHPSKCTTKGWEIVGAKNSELTASEVLKNGNGFDLLMEVDDCQHNDSEVIVTLTQKADPGVYLFQAKVGKAVTNPVRVRLQPRMAIT